MAADDLFFLRTGEETGPFVLVRLLDTGSNSRAEAGISGSAAEAADQDFRAAGDLTTVLREARDHALLRGLDLRIDLNGNSWPEASGIIGNVDRTGS